MKVIWNLFRCFLCYYSRV